MTEGFQLQKDGTLSFWNNGGFSATASKQFESRTRQGETRFQLQVLESFKQPLLTVEQGQNLSQACKSRDIVSSFDCVDCWFVLEFQPTPTDVERKLAPFPTQKAALETQNSSCRLYSKRPKPVFEDAAVENPQGPQEAVISPESPGETTLQPEPTPEKDAGSQPESSSQPEPQPENTQQPENTGQEPVPPEQTNTNDASTVDEPNLSGTCNNLKNHTAPKNWRTLPSSEGLGILLYGASMNGRYIAGLTKNGVYLWEKSKPGVYLRKKEKIPFSSGISVAKALHVGFLHNESQLVILSGARYQYYRVADLKKYTVNSKPPVGSGGKGRFLSGMTHPVTNSILVATGSRTFNYFQTTLQGGTSAIQRLTLENKTTGNYITAMHLDPSGTRLAVGYLKGHIEFYTPVSSKIKSTLRRVTSGGKRIAGIYYVNQGDQVVYGGDNGLFSFMNQKSGSPKSFSQALSSSTNNTPYPLHDVFATSRNPSVFGAVSANGWVGIWIGGKSSIFNATSRISGNVKLKKRFLAVGCHTLLISDPSSPAYLIDLTP